MLGPEVARTTIASTTALVSTPPKLSLSLYNIYFMLHVNSESREGESSEQHRSYQIFLIKCFIEKIFGICQLFKRSYINR